MNKKIISMILAGALTCSMLLAGCGEKGLDTAAVAATLGEKEITLGYLDFCVKYSQSQGDYIYSQFYSGDYWNDSSFSTDDYDTLGDMLIANALDTIERQVLLEQHMEEYGVTVTDEDMSNIEETVKAFMEANTEEALTALGATEDVVKEFLYYQVVDAKMSDAIGAEDETEITLEDAKQRRVSYLRISNTLYYDENGEQQSVTEDDLDRIREEYTEVAAKAAEDWDTVYNSFEDNSAVSALAITYGKSDEEEYSTSDFYNTVLKEADKMSEGEVSGLIEVDSAFYIIRIDDDNDEEATLDKQASLKSEAEKEYVSNRVEEYKAAVDYAVKDSVTDQIVFDTHFNY